MGLIAAALGSAGGVLADQWKDYFYCDAIPMDTLIVKGKKREGSRSTNTKGGENIITNGSTICVADGQCMLIVDQGEVVDICATPGEFTYDTSTEPSVFTGDLKESVIDVFKNIGKRFTYGGEAPKDQRVYYVNLKELMGNKYGTPQPVPYRVVDTNVGLDMDISITCFGEYSYRISNPILFYTNVAANVADEMKRDALDSQLKSELLTKLQEAFAKISAMGIRYSALPGCTSELADALNEALSSKWRDLRGIEIVSFGVSSVKAPEEDEAMIKELQRNAALRDPNMRMAHMAGATAAAMQTAAGNEGGAMNAFMGMGMANMFGGQQASAFATGGQAAPSNYAVAADGGFGGANAGWTCSCGKTNTGKFCTECGAAKPVEADGGWKCASCGTANTGKFCTECGAAKPAEAAPFVCPSCGWASPDGAAPKFCPECGAAC